MGKKHKKPVAIQILCERVGALSAWEGTLSSSSTPLHPRFPPQTSPSPQGGHLPVHPPPLPPVLYRPSASTPCRRQPGMDNYDLAVALGALKREDRRRKSGQLVSTPRGWTGRERVFCLVCHRVQTPRGWGEVFVRPNPQPPRSSPSVATPPGILVAPVTLRALK